jgi:DNA repair protein RecN (Recombination protein N)
MLVSLAIGNVVLIDKVDLEFGPGLCVLTGETGAGKSILLDSLGLALGMRANAGLVRSKPNDAPASVAATFMPGENSSAIALMADHGLELPEDGEPVILRRTVDPAGRSRAFVNDQPVSVSFLRNIGETLVEIEGQFATQGLMDTSTHRAALDGFGGLDDLRERVAALCRDYRDAEAALVAAQDEIARAREDEDLIRHAADELASLDPQPGEETELAEARALLMHGEKLIDALNTAETALTKGDGVEDRIGAAVRSLTRQTEAARGRFDAILDALERAMDGVSEALLQLGRVMADAEPDPHRLDTTEERLFALRAAARKHNTTVDALADLRQTLEAKLAAIDNTGDTIRILAEKRDRLKADYIRQAETLSKKRTKAAAALDAAVQQELPPLRLEKARFSTVLTRLDETDWGPNGVDRVHFEVTTNPGAPSGPLSRIASGGELARFLLALKVVMHRANGVPTLVFDEVDSGVGGATASAVGERLAQLAKDIQVLVVTHSPQVAAYGAHHLRVAKQDRAGGVVTVVDDLVEGDRREEIARMLAGAEVTEEARAAAASLIVEPRG